MLEPSFVIGRRKMTESSVTRSGTHCSLPEGKERNLSSFVVFVFPWKIAKHRKYDNYAIVSFNELDIFQQTTLSNEYQA